MGYLFHEDCYSDSDNYPRKRPDGWTDEDEKRARLGFNPSEQDEEDFDCGEDDPRFDCDPGEYVASDEELNLLGDLMCDDGPLDY